MNIAHHSPHTWRPRFGARHARGPLPPSKRDPLAECRRFDGKTMRHRFTKQVRRMFVRVLDERRGILFEQGRLEAIAFIEREPRKALRWLRNAVEVA